MIVAVSGYEIVVLIYYLFVLVVLSFNEIELVHVLFVVLSNLGNNQA